MEVQRSPTTGLWYLSDERTCIDQGMGMTLTLEIINPGAHGEGVEPRKVFRNRGGTIGRLRDNDWFLPHDLVSKRHASIEFDGDGFSIEDTDSANGVFINSNEYRLAIGERYQLKSGDRIIIEPYEIRARMADGDEELVSDESADSERVRHLDNRASEEFESSDAYGRFGDDQVDPGSSHGAPRFIDAPVNRDAPYAREAVTPFVSQALPSDPARPQAAADRAQSIDLQEVLRAAGLNVPAVAPDVAESLGRILRVVVSGLMQVLRARQELKSEFRVEMTKYQPTENNPLRFSVDVEDALYNLFVKRHSGYLGPVAAFEDAFDDIRDHEVAMLAGMHAAFQMMLSHFEPDRLQEAFDRQLRESALMAVPGAARLRYWEMYRNKIRELVKDPEASFRDLFGEEFASAYEEQLERLKLRRRDARE